MEERWKGVTESEHDQYLVYIEAIGGMGTNTTRMAGPTCSHRLQPRRIISLARRGYPTTSWLQFTNTQIPAANGTIEIRLHLSKIECCPSDKLSTMTGYFDNISLTY